jgi:hypothetical protein
MIILFVVKFSAGANRIDEPGVIDVGLHGFAGDGVAKGLLLAKNLVQLAFLLIR